MIEDGVSVHWYVDAKSMRICHSSLSLSRPLPVPVKQSCFIKMFDLLRIIKPMFRRFMKLRKLWHCR